MTICDFCYNGVFQSTFQKYEWRAHHATTATWRESVQDSCTICTLLFEHVTAIFARQAVTASGETPDCTQCDQVWGFLDGKLPIYEVGLTDLQIKWQWLLQFRPRAQLHQVAGLALQPRVQNFVVYLSRCKSI